MSFGSADLIVKRVVINPKGGPVVGGTTDPSCGLELIEIQNVGDAPINLGTNNVAVVVVDNERDHGGQLDTYWTLTGTLGVGESYIIQDLTNTSGAGSTIAIASPNGSAVTNGVHATQWHPDGSTPQAEYELENSAGNYMIVGGFHADLANNVLADTLNAQKMDTDDNLIMDWVGGSTADDLWSTQYDAMVVYPSDETLGDYTGGLTWPHKVVSAETDSDAAGSFTADYVFRVYRMSGLTKIWDDAIAVELENFDTVNNYIPISHNLNSTATTEFRSFSGHGRSDGTILFYTPGNVQITGSVTGYVLYGQDGNWTNKTNYGYIKINGVIYQH